MTISSDEKEEEVKKVHQPRLPSFAWFRTDKSMGIDQDQEAVIIPNRQSLEQMNNEKSITNENDGQNIYLDKKEK